MIAIPKELINLLDVKNGNWILKDGASSVQKQLFKKFLEDVKEEQKNLGIKE